MRKPILLFLLLWGALSCGAQPAALDSLMKAYAAREGVTGRTVGADEIAAARSAAVSEGAEAAFLARLDESRTLGVLLVSSYTADAAEPARERLADRLGADVRRIAGRAPYLALDALSVEGQTTTWYFAPSDGERPAELVQLTEGILGVTVSRMRGRFGEAECRAMVGELVERSL